MEADNQMIQFLLTNVYHAFSYQGCTSHEECLLRGSRRGRIVEGWPARVSGVANSDQNTDLFTEELRILKPFPLRAPNDCLPMK